ncbi:hypothetical protein D3C78_1839360 [compost metagenome]
MPSLPLSGARQRWLNLLSRRYMAGRVSRAPGEDETSLLQALEAINGGSYESAVDRGEASVATLV